MHGPGRELKREYMIKVWHYKGGWSDAPAGLPSEKTQKNDYLSSARPTSAEINFGVQNGMH
jgi:hypothetical protein